jgi:AcrR family transcriptional regulator
MALPPARPAKPARPASTAGPARGVRPRRADAARNRQALLAAARRVFERDGFVTARITDIADEAGLAHGSFYSHFQSKEDALAAVLGEVEEEMLHPGPSLAGSLGADAGTGTDAGSDPIAAIHAANVAYLEAYRRNARLMALLEQVATVDERFATLRLERTDAFLARNARAIRRLQQAGLADPALDPGLASLALSTMVSRSAYVAFALGREPAGLEALADTLTRLWVNALRIPPDPED